VLAALLLSHTASAQSPAEPFELAAGLTLEREMAGAQAHTYRVELRAGELFRVRVEQKGSDVTLRLADPDGKVVARMDSPNGNEGPEVLSFVAEQAGRYVLTLAGLDEKTPKGHYSLTREVSRVATAVDRRRAEVERSFVEGLAQRHVEGGAEAAVKTLEGALAGWKELGDTYLADVTAREILSLKALSEQNIALEKFAVMNKLLLAGYASLKEAQELRVNGQVKGSSELLGQSKSKASEADEQFRRAGEMANKMLADYLVFAAANPKLKSFPYFAKVGEANVAVFLSNHFNLLLESAEQLRHARLAASLSKEARAMETYGIGEGDKIFPEVSVLQSIAASLVENKRPEAIGYYEQTLSAYLELKKLGYAGYDKKMEAQFLHTLATLHFDGNFCKEGPSGCNRKVVEYVLRAIPIYDSLSDKQSAAFLYGMLPPAYFELDEVYKAFEASDRAVALSEAGKDKDVAVAALMWKATLYRWLGNKEKAHELIRKGLEVRLSTPSHTAGIESASLTPIAKRNLLKQEYTRLVSIGTAYTELGDARKAVEYYTLSLPVARQTGDGSNEAHSLSNIGFAHKEMKDWATALDYKGQSAALFRQLGDRRSQAKDLTDIGMIYLDTGRPEDALRSLHAAELALRSAGEDDDSSVANNLARAWHALGNRRLAIFYGKKFANWVQDARRGLNDFDKATQQSFVSSFDKSIRRLADWLIEEGSFAQAEQVLRILKEEEISAFVRRDADEIKGLVGRVRLDKPEQKVIEQYKLLGGRVSEIGQAFSALDEKKRQLSRRGLALPAEEQRRYDELERQAKVANDAFLIFLDKSLSEEFGKVRREQVEVQYSKQEELRKLDGTVTLYTVVGEDRYRVILTTPSVQLDGKYEIKAEELNKKVFAFREALNNPQLDPRPLGKELYDILLRPIEADLKAAGAKTLLWSLDGTLRYIPLAALSPDGKRYLVEDFRNVVITPKTGLGVVGDDAKWRVLGLGVSGRQSVTAPYGPDGLDARMDFEALPGTTRELLAIIRDERSRGEVGILPGRRLIDAEFTSLALKDSLAQQTASGRHRFNVIHIASHFHLGGNRYSSFLLMGGGQILTLSDISGSNIKFGDAALITLSACNTAFADNSNGTEVDTLAEVIQSQGGRAVLAALWRVSDESTSLLMTEFYRVKKESPGLTKSEALRRAQRAMLGGSLASRAKEKSAARAKLAGGADPQHGRRGVPFDSSNPYAHPYYWSPFVLIGNWK
jgi:CHAT domain-containing protein